MARNLRLTVLSDLDNNWNQEWVCCFWPLLLLLLSATPQSGLASKNLLKTAKLSNGDLIGRQRSQTGSQTLERLEFLFGLRKIKPQTWNSKPLNHLVFIDPSVEYRQRWVLRTRIFYLVWSKPCWRPKCSFFLEQKVLRHPAEWN